MGIRRSLPALAMVAALGTAITAAPYARARPGHSEKAERKTPHRAGDSDFAVTFGVSLSKGFGSSDSDQSGAPTDFHTDHKRPASIALDDGETGAPGAGGSGGTAAPSLDPTMTARADYRVTRRIGLGLLVGFGAASGVLDPELGPTLRLPLAHAFSLDSALTASAPLSRASHDMHKITTVKLTSGPNIARGRFALAASVIVAYAWYSKTVIVDDPSPPAAALRADRTPGAQDRALLAGPAEPDVPEGDNGGFNGPSGDNLSSGNREFSRYGLRTSFGYRVARHIRIDSSLGAARINRQFGKPIWSTDATISQLSFRWSNLTAYLAAGVRKTAPVPAAPTEPGISLGAGYVFK